MKAIFFVLLVSIPAMVRGQIQFADLEIRSGTTRTTWSGFLEKNSSYVGNYGWYLGLASEIKIGTKLRKITLGSQLNYRHLQMGFKHNSDQLQMNEVAIVLRPSYMLKRFKFGIEGSFALVMNKKIRKEGQLDRVPLSSVFNEYSNLGGTVEYRINTNLSFEIGQTFLSTPIRRYKSCGATSGGGCWTSYEYQRVTQLGLRFSLS